MKPMKTEVHRSGGVHTEGPGRYPGRAGLRVVVESVDVERTKAERSVKSGLMDVVCERGNLWLAYERVIRNQGAAGVDGIGVFEFKAHLQQH